MQIIDEGLFIKLLPDKGMILTDRATETMRAEEIYLGKSDSANNYKDIPVEPKTDLTVTDTLGMLEESGIDANDKNEMNAHEGIKEWINPKESQKPYNKSDKCYYKEQFWISTIDNNISEPGSFANTWINI